MISLTEMEEIAVQIGNPYTHWLNPRQRREHLEHVEKSHDIELTPDERIAVMKRADEHRAARDEKRDVAPAAQAKILPFRLKGDTA